MPPVGERPEPRAGWQRPALIVLALALAALALALRDLALRLPPGQWGAALLAPDATDTRQMLVHLTVMPRIAVALLCGAGLGLAGAVCQQVLRNPLAEPTTLGISAGASLALSAATLWAPGLLAYGREGVALAGSFAALLFVFGLAWRRALSPVSLVLAGLIVTLYCGALASALSLFHRDYLIGIYLWGAGFLSQQGWGVAAFLLPRLGVAAFLIALMVRPLTLLGLDDEAARNLGLGLTGARLAALVVAVSLSAAVTSAVGVIGFVGLAAPAIVAIAGARRLRDRLVWAPLCGAALLWLTDGLVLLIPTGYREVPTGAATALLGAPVMLALLPRLRKGVLWRAEPAAAVPRAARPGLVLAAGAGLLALALWGALAFAYGPRGWSWAGLTGIAEMLPWRGPRVAAALAAGAMLAMAGMLLQRMMNNPMASPEVLGVSSGAALGVIVALFLTEAPSRVVQLAAGTAGAFAVLLGILVLGRRDAFSPERLLLAGVATSAAFGAIVAVAMATGDPRVGTLLTWLAGSTYGVDPGEAAGFLAAAAILAGLAPMLARWLDILPLGAATAQAVGLHVPRVRLVVMLAAAVMTAVPTLVVGPLSFVGLMAPHIARLIGLQRALHHLVGAAILGALLLTLADWAGRTIIFPYQMPAGLLATVIGGPYLMWLLRRR
ncbi:Fe(3+)-hydroxamate ABC transporter permease FhuB [Methylobacterium aquaticum]|uniref:Fe(3+)-hydroxamate ABC transporter permease FhuB n=1 Tax=Methylobacterium aquaticum TaxID=270351 RepID=UPI000B24C656|nr:Fe(3+)-hydroxamate ABC transporter permease FhuB [Methylobacterium aquaticum]